MIERILSTLFPQRDQPLVYAAYLSGTRFATQWTVYAGPTVDIGAGGGSLHEILFYLELDLAAIGQGGSPLRQRCRLLCDDTLRPVRYRSQAPGVSVGLTFEGEEVHVDMPDGSRQVVPRAGAEFVIEANMTGQQALMLAVAHHRGQLQGDAQFLAFVVNGLLSVPYGTTAAPDLGEGRWLRSSHEEELQLSPDGLLLLARTPTQGIEIRREDPAPPLPEWHLEERLKLDVPVYHPPEGASFRLEEVEIPGAVTPLGGTLSIPPGAGPHPAVLFLSGSGTHDRHGIAGEVDLGTHEIMDQLAEAGYLGLRYDTRGAGRTRLGQDALEQGLETIVEDARAALRYLRARPEVDPRRLFLLGHSQGGTVALVLAAEEADLAGVALLATIGRNIDELLLEQTDAYLRRLGLGEEQIESQKQRLRDYVEFIRAGRSFVAGEVPDYLLLGARGRKWIQEHLRNPTTELIRRIRCPVLLCQGDKDFQVSPERDARPLVEAAQQAGVDLRYELLPGLDHLFKRVQGEQSTIEQYFDRSRHVDRSLLDVLLAWLGKLSAR